MGCRSILYVDGFNLYYGAVRGTSYKWFNLERLFSLLRQDNDIQEINYFTAMIDGPRLSNQKTYLRALATCNKINIILGKFKKKQVTCQVLNCTHKDSRIFSVTEEKRTDVNIAVKMLDDTFHDRADRFVVISGDSDLVPVIDYIKSSFPEKKIIVYVPSRDLIRGAAFELSSSSDKNKTLPLAL
ncbi:MAG: NYN domain-containing protein [Planctomycetota bacterium]